MTDCIIPEGYKKTSLGVIPKEWEAVRIHEICTLVNGRAYKQNELLSEGKYKILRVGNFFTNDSWYFSDLELEANKYACKGDLLYAWSASFGPRFWTEEKVIYHYHIWKICDLKGIDKQYLYFFLDYDASLLQNAIQGGTMHHITKNDMEKRFIPLPPMEEQQNIAKVLNTWDKAIEKQTQLIEKLELRKKGLMQQLLIGKKRLPGFSGEWKKAKLGDATIFLSTNSFSREQLNSVKGNVLNIHYGDVLVRYSSVLDASKEDIPYINEQIEYSPKDYVNSGDVIMADTAEDEMVGRCCEVINIDNIKVVSGLHTILIHPIIKFAPKYLGYYLNSERYHKQIISIMQGIKVYSITKDALKNTIIDIPNIEEQAAIANILSLCDNEILLAKQKLNSFQQQKKGLIQVLLTGKKRVVL